MLKDSKLGLEHVPKVIRMMNINGSIKYSLLRAKDYVKLAVSEIKALSGNLDLTILHQVAEYILSRNK